MSPQFAPGTPDVTREIVTQPMVWHRALELAASPHTVDALPEDGARTAIVGCGTSHNMARVCAKLREDAGRGETDAFPASEFPSGRHYDHVVAITRTGTTTEVIRLLEALPSAQRSTVFTTDPDHPVTRSATHTVLLDFADERSLVATRFATSVLVVWRAAMTGGIGTALDDVGKALATPLGDLVERDQFTFLGTGWTVGLADEAALKLREAAQGWAEAYPAMEFRHGPISVVDERSAVWVFGPVPDGLADEVAAVGSRLVHSDLDPLADLTTAQRLVVALAGRRGLDPDRPRHLHRSVVLPTR